MNYSYVSMDRIFSKLGRDVTKTFSEGDIIEWTGEALEFMGTVKSYESAVAFIEVENHQCILPKGLHAIIQVARNNRWSSTNKECCTPNAIIEGCKVDTVGVNPSKPCVCPDSDAVWLDCKGQPIVAYDLAYYRPYFDLKQEYYGWVNSNYYRQHYSPVRLANNSFFNSLVCSLPGDQQIYKSCRDEYTIVQKSLLRLSFKEGSVAVAYERQVLEPETGYPMIPDSISHTTAIIKYITMMMASRDFQNNREGAKGKLDKAEQDWHWYCKQAGNLDLIPHGIDEHQDMLDQRSYILPKRNAYFGFFGNQSQPDMRLWENK